MPPGNLSVNPQPHSACREAIRVHNPSDPHKCASDAQAPFTSSTLTGNSAQPDYKTVSVSILNEFIVLKVMVLFNLIGTQGHPDGEL